MICSTSCNLYLNKLSFVREEAGGSGREREWGGEEEGLGERKCFTNTRRLSLNDLR